MEFKTEYEFTLPRGYVDADGNVHRQGVMRLATAKDEIAPLNDLRVQRNRAYLIIVLLSRVITRLGTLSEVSSQVIEGLYAGDLRFLEEMYNRINEDEAVLTVTCPECGAHFEREFGRLGES
ncbi:MAG: phage tail assembly protein [Myxococcota bacterium]